MNGYDIPLQFHEIHGEKVEVASDRQTAWRIDATDDENGTVLYTNRHLLTDELFEIKIEELDGKWMDDVHIGVTTAIDHDSLSDNLLDTLADLWVFTSSGFYVNGVRNAVYGDPECMSNLTVNSTIGVIRNENGDLYLTISSVNYGKFASNVPSETFGVVSVKGKTTKIRLISRCDSNEQLRFHHLRGRNARIKNDGKTAFRPNSHGEFNNAVVVSNRPLRDDEIFEVTIESMTGRWSGSIEIGITKIPPESIDFPTTMTDINHDTWVLRYFESKEIITFPI